MAIHALDAIRGRHALDVRDAPEIHDASIGCRQRGSQQGWNGIRATGSGGHQFQVLELATQLKLPGHQHPVPACLDRIAKIRPREARLA